MSVIEIANVSKTYGEVKALDGVSLVVEPGSITGLLGINGAGKSTLLRMMIGLEDPDHGTIEVLGFDPQREPVPLRLHTGFLPEQKSMYDWMTVDEAIEFVSSFYPNWDSELVETRRLRFDLPSKTKIGALSRGQFARLAFLLATGHRPEVLLLDEPSYGLDPIVRREFLGLIAEIVAEEETTVLLSSHLLSEIERIADHVVILHRGRVLVDRALEDLVLGTHLLSLPPEFDVSRLRARIVRVREKCGEREVTVTDCEPEFLADLPPEVAVWNMSLEDVFCEYAEAADETAST